MCPFDVGLVKLRTTVKSTVKKEGSNTVAQRIDKSFAHKRVLRKIVDDLRNGLWLKYYFIHCVNDK